MGVESWAADARSLLTFERQHRDGLIGGERAHAHTDTTHTHTYTHTHNCCMALRPIQVSASHTP